jgi:hypothetical protein
MFITGSTARPDQDRPGVWIAENYFVPGCAKDLDIGGE